LSILFVSKGSNHKMSESVYQVLLIDDDEDDYIVTQDLLQGAEQAVCLWSLEVIETLMREGHPIAPGNAGENVTIAGLDWPLVIPGVHLQLGNDVVIEIASYAAPCRKNMCWFTDKRYSRISQKHYPGSSRVYARVLQPGIIRQDDLVKIADSPTPAAFATNRN
ncbi:MAG: MOSC domain-containing protein, partial [Leptolyngbya sp. SIO1D8]|nr:MOSC domain-containing protein [Leptolyngbya sp. SIO1D8]